MSTTTRSVTQDHDARLMPSASSYTFVAPVEVLVVGSDFSTGSLGSIQTQQVWTLTESLNWVAGLEAPMHSEPDLIDVLLQQEDEEEDQDIRNYVSQLWAEDWDEDEPEDSPAGDR